MTRSLRSLMSAGSLALLALMVVAACGASPGPGAGSGDGARQEDAGSSGEEAAGGGDPGNPTLGDPDAPVLMVEWGDFQ